MLAANTCSGGRGRWITLLAYEMLDDPNASGDDDVRALHVISDYLAGHASLESAVRELRALDATDTSAEYTDDTFGEAPDAVLGVDRSVMPPGQRERLDALLRALQDDSPDTA